MDTAGSPRTPAPNAAAAQGEAKNFGDSTRPGVNARLDTESARRPWATHPKNWMNPAWHWMFSGSRETGRRASGRGWKNKSVCGSPVRHSGTAAHHAGTRWVT